MDDDSAIDFNTFPFQIRFTNNNKIYHECRALVEELGDIFYKMNTEIRDKLEIRNILSILLVSFNVLLSLILVPVYFRRIFYIYWTSFKEDKPFLQLH